MNRVIIENLEFSYGSKKILNNLNLEIEEGLYGLLGRNGAGKSTLMKLMVGLLHPDKGRISLYGRTQISERREIIGYLPQDFNFYQEMTILESLTYLGTLDGISRRELKRRIEELLELVNLTHDRGKKVGKLSGGMKRRFGIATSLLNDPKVLIVDEPTAGLDPEERIRFRSLLRNFSRDRTVILSTHIASDLEKTADSLGILEKGRVIYSGSLKSLIEANTNGVYKTEIPLTELERFKKEYVVFEEQYKDEDVEVSFIYNGRPLQSFRRIEPTLESSYLGMIYRQEE